MGGYITLYLKDGRHNIRYPKHGAGHKGLGRVNPNRNRFGWFGRLARHGVDECVRWPPTIMSMQHVAWQDTLEATLWHDYLCFSAITANPQP